MPAIEMYPPSGSALMPYSVSPRRNGEDGAAEADHVLADPHPEQFRRNQVADLVQRDRDRHPDDDDQDADDVGEN